MVWEGRGVEEPGDERHSFRRSVMGDGFEVAWFRLAAGIWTGGGLFCHETSAICPVLHKLGVEVGLLVAGLSSRVKSFCGREWLAKVVCRSAGFDA